MISFHNEMLQEHKENVRGGQGAFISSRIFPEPLDAKVFLARNVLPAGVSIGVHTHSDDSEAYIILKGTAMVTDDGTEYEMHPGDAEYCAVGHSHGLYNPGPEDVEFLAVFME